MEEIKDGMNSRTELVEKKEGSVAWQEEVVHTSSGQLLWLSGSEQRLADDDKPATQ